MGKGNVPMKRITAIMCGLFLAASLAACGQGSGETSSASVSAGGVSSRESSVQESVPAQSGPSSSLAGKIGPGPQVMEAQVFVQKNSGAEEGYEPTIRLLENGSFEFSLYLYDGTAFLSGTYAEEGEDYVLTPTESTAQGFAASDVGEIRLSKTEGGVTYSGEQLGVTADGAEFAAEEG